VLPPQVVTVQLYQVEGVQEYARVTRPARKKPQKVPPSACRAESTGSIGPRRCAPLRIAWTGEERRRADARPRAGLRDAGSARSRTHAARHDKIGPRARGFCRCEFGVVHSGRERTYQDDRLELATPRIECQKPMSIGENPGPPIVQKPPERSIALLCHLREVP
jgi:hypothetical protein